MAYHFDQYDNSLVIDGFENGIADTPYAGLSDMRNANIISIPGEASVNFATSLVSNATMTGTVTSADATADTITYNTLAAAEARIAIVFSVTTIAGLSAGTIYWLKTGATTTVASLSTKFDLSNTVNITATGTGTFTAYTVQTPKYFAYDKRNSKYWMIDSSGQVWTNLVTTTSGLWTFTGNNPPSAGTGNGLVYYQASDGSGYIFVLRNQAIDYIDVSGVTWVYNWKPSDGTNGAGYNALKTSGVTLDHEAFTAPTNQVIVCDSNWITRWYEKNPATAFVPATPSTYVFDQTALLPTTDAATSVTYLGSDYLVGGQKNMIYVWNGTSTTWSSVILLPENNVAKMVTVNTNTYIFVGNRGRIYYTSGSQAQLYKKVPDHISGTIEPYFTWGGATFNKNQIYFGVSCTNNAGTQINQYGGLWGIDVDTGAMRLTNQLSYATYGGYATAIIANFGTTPAGTGLLIGWDSLSTGSPLYGIDTTSGSPYTGGQTIIDSDLIPIGTFQKPRDFTKVEYRLRRPLVSGETIAIKTRLIFNTSDTGYTTTLTDSTAGNYSNIGDINFQNAQWVQFQMVLTSTASTPSYVTLREIRILGLTGPTMANAPQLSL